MRIQFVPVGRSTEEWIWRTRDGGKVISMSGQHFRSLPAAIQDAHRKADSEEIGGDDPDPLIA
jgi:hypothetical protein